MPAQFFSSTTHFLIFAHRLRALALLLLTTFSGLFATVVPVRADGRAVRDLNKAQATGANSEALGLQDAVRRALRESPELKAFARSAEGALARVRQAALWPNPEIEFERENFGGSGQFSGAEAAEDTLTFSQLLPLGGDIRQQRRLAEAESDRVAWDYHIARLGVVLDTNRRYIETLAAEHHLDLARREMEVVHQLESVTEKKVEVGEASPVERLRVAVPVIEAELRLTRAKLASAAARQRLALAWSERSLGETRLTGTLKALSPLPEPAALVTTINNSPEVARWAAEISASRAAQKLARAEAIPDLVLSLGIRQNRFIGDNGLVAGISLPLPLFDRKQGSLAVARSTEQAAFESRRATELRIESELSAGYFILAVAHAESTALQKHALPAAREAYQATFKAFSEGELSYLDVLDASQVLLELERRQVDALAAYHYARAELAALLGGRQPKTSK